MVRGVGRERKIGKEPSGVSLQSQPVPWRAGTWPPVVEVPAAASQGSASPCGGGPSPLPAASSSLCSTSLDPPNLPCTPSSSSCSHEQRSCSLFYVGCGLHVSALSAGRRKRGKERESNRMRERQEEVRDQEMENGQVR